MTLNKLIAFEKVGCGEFKRRTRLNGSVDVAGENAAKQTRKSLNLEGAQINVVHGSCVIAVGVLNVFHLGNYFVGTCFGKNVVNGATLPNILPEIVFVRRRLDENFCDSAGVSNAVNGKRYVGEVSLPPAVMTLNELIAYIELGCGEIKRISGFNRNIDVALPIVKTGRSNFFLCRYAHRYNGEHCNDHEH